MFLTSRMMILNKEKANCAASTGVHQSSKHQCQGDVFISFKASLKILSSNCYENGSRVLEKEEKIN